MKSVAVLATAVGLAAAATGPQFEVCAAIDPACAAPLLCAPVVANGDCINLPIPADLAPVVGSMGIEVLYTKATVNGAVVDAQLFKDAACVTPLAAQFKLSPNACTQIPDQIIYVVAKGEITAAPPADSAAPAAPSAPAEATPIAAAGEEAAAATTTAAAGTEHATMHATTAAATTTAAETMPAAETAPATQAATRRNARLAEAGASSVVPTAFALCAAVFAALLN